MEEEQNRTQPEQPEEKTQWQKTKEGWYDKVPLNLKQLDIIIGICFFLLALTILFIILDAMNIFHLFG